MRKILLATTAIVAVTGVSHAEVSINGYYEFGYQSVSDDQSTDVDDMYDDHEIHVSFSSTTDTGLTFGAKTEMEGSADVATTHNDESSMYVSGDFGKIVMGQNDGAGSSFLTFPGYGSNSMGSNDIGTHNKNSSGTALTGAYPFPQYGRDGDNNKITYFSPSMGGFSFGYSYSDEGTDNADTSAGLSYSADMSGVGVTVTAMMEDSGESTKTTENAAYGVMLTSGAFDLGVSTGTTKTGTTVDSNTTIYGLGYAVSDDLRVAVNGMNSENDVTNGDKYEAYGAAVNYTIASGLTLNVGMTSFEATDGDATSLNNDGTVIRTSLKMSF